jgi:hypothetical protein
MKKTLFFAYILVVIFLLGCAKEEVTKPAKTFPVNPRVLAMNIEIAGKPFNIEFGKDGWDATGHCTWSAYNWVPKYIHHNKSLLKENTLFAIYAPLMEIADPNNINGTYTYENLLNFFKKGKQVLRDPKNKVGYDFFFTYKIIQLILQAIVLVTIQYHKAKKVVP